MSDQPSTELEGLLIAALADTASRNPVGSPPSLQPEPAMQPERARRPGRPSPRAWLVPALVAAVLVALTVGALTVFRPTHHQRIAPAGGTVQVTWRATSRLSSTQLQAAGRILGARIAALGGTASYLLDPGSQQITADLPAGMASAAAGLGAVSALEFRPMMVDMVPASGPARQSTGQVVDQWRSLGFTPPADAAGYAALSPARQQAVRAVLAGWNCAAKPLDRPDRPIVTCSQDGYGKYLLGTAIVAPGDVQGATASAPGGGRPAWSVVVELTPAGQRKWTDYTSAHNESQQRGAVANQVADLVDGQVLLDASTIEETITDGTEITGNYTEPAAQRLAAVLASGPLPTTFQLVGSR